METGDELAILVVDDDLTVREAIRSYAERNYGHLRILEETDLGQASDRLARESVDCLVVDPDTLDEEDVNFFEYFRAQNPDRPVIWLTDRSPSALEETLLDVGTTIVEKGEDLTEWSFLFEKIQSAIQVTSISKPDQELFRTLVESASDGLYTLDATGRVVYLNEAFAEMLGYSKPELLGAHASMVMADGELEQGQQLIQELLEDGTRETDIMDMKMLRKDGTAITVSVHFRVLTTEDGTYDGVMGVVRDITERKRRERALERQRDRLEEFASVVSHDLQTPLTVAKGRIELVQEEYESEDLDAAAEALARMEQLITDLLDLAQQGKMVEDLEPVDLDSIVRESWGDVTPQVDADLQTDLEGCVVRADPDRLRQMFENLFQNAVDHAGSGVTVTVGSLEGRRGFYVEDDGPGLADGARDRVFDRGYSTREEGTGFGLTIVEQIARAHDWTISVGEAATGGARFEIVMGS